MTNTQAARPSIDLFKAIFAESSDESPLSSGESDVEIIPPSSTLKGQINAIGADKSSSEPYPSGGRLWQDLSSVTGSPLDRNTGNLQATATVLPSSVMNTEHTSGEQSDLTEVNEPQDQPMESYGPALPPGMLL